MKTETSLNISGVPSSLVTWGKGIAEVNDTKEAQDIILMIPGNPGYVPLYEEFLEDIHNRLGIPIWILGHAGHEPETRTLKFPPVRGNEALYDTNGQVIHKQTFIETYVPENARLHLIGHSIGPYIILQLLKIPAIQKKVVGSYLLFPTIERLAESPKGKSTVAFLKYQRLVLFFIQLFALLPIIFQSLFMEVIGLISGTPKRYRRMYVNFVNPSMIKKVFVMADHEMANVKERDTDTLKANKDKIKLYYGSDDGWTPKSYYTELQRDIPGIDVEINGSKIKHAFVSRHSKEVANLVADWIQKKKL